MTTLLQQKKNSINFTKANKKISYNLHYSGDESYLFVYRTKIFKFLNDNMRWYVFCLGSVSKGLTKDELTEISLNGTAYDFSVDHNSILKEEICLILMNT